MPYPTDIWQSEQLDSLLSRKVQSPLRAALISVVLSPPQFGWMNLTISTHAQEVTIFTSDVFDPYPDMVQWLRFIGHGKLPRIMDIDEEGDVKVLAAFHVREGDIRFMVGDYDYGAKFEDDPDYPKVYIDVEIDKTGFLQEFCTTLYRGLNKDFLQTGWPVAAAESLWGISVTISLPGVRKAKLCARYLIHPV